MTATGRRRVTVVALIGSLAVVVALPYMSLRQIRVEHERGARVLADIRAFATELGDYKGRHGSYPTTDQGLGTLGVARETRGSAITFTAVRVFTIEPVTTFFLQVLIARPIHRTMTGGPVKDLTRRYSQPLTA